MNNQPNNKKPLTQAEVRMKLAKARHEQATKIAAYKLSQAIKAITPGGEQRRAAT